jgi:hypothetical protein
LHLEYYHAGGSGGFGGVVLAMLMQMFLFMNELEKSLQMVKE